MRGRVNFIGYLISISLWILLYLFHNIIICLYIGTINQFQFCLSKESIVQRDIRVTCLTFEVGSSSLCCCSLYLFPPFSTVYRYCSHFHILVLLFVFCNTWLLLCITCFIHFIPERFHSTFSSGEVTLFFFSSFRRQIQARRRKPSTFFNCLLCFFVVSLANCFFINFFFLFLLMLLSNSPHLQSMYFCWFVCSSFVIIEFPERIEKDKLWLNLLYTF